MNTHQLLSIFKKRSAFVLLGAFLTFLFAPHAAASSWNPTLLVNTESFQEIDNGDGSTDIELRFGSSVQKLFYDPTNHNFAFTRGLHVGGDITSTGSLTVSGAVTVNQSGGDNDTQIQGDNDTNLVYVDASTDRVGIGVATPETKLEVVGTISGTQVHAQDTLTTSGDLVVDGDATFNGSVNFTTLEGVTISGSNVHAQDSLTSSGTLRVTGTSELEGTISGAALDIQGASTFDGALTFGDTIADTITVNAGSWTFANDTTFDLGGNTLEIAGLLSGATLHSEGDTTVSGSLVVDGDATFNGSVNFTTLEGVTISGSNVHAQDSLTSSGTLRVTGTSELEGTLSGSTIRAQDALASSGTLSVDGNTTLQGTLTTVGLAQFRGGASGSTITAQTSLASSGTLSVDGQTTLNGLSGSTITGFGLTECDGATQKLQWNDITQQFECGTDTAYSTGTVLEMINSNFVNISGDTMTGALTVDVTGENTTALSISGAAIFNEDGLNNDVRIEGDTDANLLITDASADRVGIGVATPETKLEVVGTISGTQVHAQDTLTTSGDLVVDGDATFNGSVNFTTLEGVTISGSNVHAQDSLTSSGTLRVTGTSELEGTISGAALDIQGASTFDGALTFGDTIADTITVNAGSWTFANDTTFDLGGNTLEIAGLLSGATLHSEGDTTVSGSLVVDGDATFNGSVNFTTLEGVTISGSNVHAQDSLTSSGTLRVTGTSELEGTLSGSTIRAQDALASSGTLSVDGNTTLQGTLTTVGLAQFRGGASGSTITAQTSLASSGTLSVDGQTTLNGLSGSTITGFGLTDCNTPGNVLQWDSGTEQFVCAQSQSGSGDILFLSPEYPHAVYFASGSTTVGQLAYDYDTTNRENYYRWTSSKAAIQDYWVSTRIRVPDNFSSWDGVAPIQFRYRTGAAASATNHLGIRFIDTAGTEIALTGGADLASTAWATANITGPEASGTYTAGEYITVLVKLATTSAGSADAGYLELNWETSQP